MNIPTPTPHQHLRVLRLPQVRQVTGLGRSMIYQLEAEKRFPSRIKIGARAVGWLHEEVQQWLAERVAQRAASARGQSPPRDAP